MRNVKLERALAVARSSLWAVFADCPIVADWNNGLKKSHAIGDPTEGVGGVSTGYCGWRRGGLLGGPHAAPMRNGRSWAAVTWSALAVNRRSPTTRLPATSTGTHTVATKTVPHGQAFCPIGNRSVHNEDRRAGASCPYCGIHLPKKHGTVLVVVEDDGTVVSSELVPEPSFWKRAGPILAILLVGILIILAVASVVGDNSNPDSGSTRFNGIILDYEPQNPASITVKLQVRNAGTVSSGWECTVRARDESDTYTGGETLYEDTPLAANSSTTGIGTIMITNDGSAYVTQVWVDGCKARAPTAEPKDPSEASG